MQEIWRKVEASWKEFHSWLQWKIGELVKATYNTLPWQQTRHTFMFLLTAKFTMTLEKHEMQQKEGLKFIQSPKWAYFPPHGSPFDQYVFFRLQCFTSNHLSNYYLKQVVCWEHLDFSWWREALFGLPWAVSVNSKNEWIITLSAGIIICKRDSCRWFNALSQLL